VVWAARTGPWTGRRRRPAAAAMDSSVSVRRRGAPRLPSVPTADGRRLVDGMAPPPRLRVAAAHDVGGGGGSAAVVAEFAVDG